MKTPEQKGVSIKIEKAPVIESEPETFTITQHHIHEEPQRIIDNSPKLVKLSSAPALGQEVVGQIAVTIADPARAGVIKRPRAIIPKPKRTDENQTAPHLSSLESHEVEHTQHTIHTIKQTLREENQGENFQKSMN